MSDSDPPDGFSVEERLQEGIRVRVGDVCFQPAVFGSVVEADRAAIDMSQDGHSENRKVPCVPEVKVLHSKFAVLDLDFTVVPRHLRLNGGFFRFAVIMCLRSQMECQFRMWLSYRS